MNKEDFIDMMMDRCLTHIRKDQPPLDEIAAAKHYNKVVCEKFWDDYFPAIVTKFTILKDNEKIDDKL